MYIVENIFFGFKKVFDYICFYGREMDIVYI